MEKVYIELKVVDGYPPVRVESVWAEKVAENVYKVSNIPFYSKQVCLDDEVRTSRGIDGEAVFVGIESDEGNSTVRIIFFGDNESLSLLILADLSGMGCSWEGLSKKFFSVNVPENIDFEQIVGYLEKKSEAGVLDYEYGMVRQ
ncbi:DUF4265 domain-containing protein [Pseudomonas sp. NPDC089401]|uniref:DUF4265 domain-containing protein n=1 Tax=Pseudomonas sp. NPDC089401 TaxID=3364462 RepID=UPI003825B553